MSLPVGETSLILDSPAGKLDARLSVPEHSVAVSVLAHGAGAGIDHANMQAIAEAFAAAGVATLRFNFPYMQQGRRRVDGKDLAVECIGCAVRDLRGRSALPLILAGHSFGGRMCSHAIVDWQEADADIDCAALIFCSFPLHPPRKPSSERAAHMGAISQPVLFLSGTRDDLAQADLLTVVAQQMQNARIHWLDTANHTYVVLKRTRNHPLTVFEEMSGAVREFVTDVL